MRAIGLHGQARRIGVRQEDAAIRSANLHLAQIAERFPLAERDPRCRTASGGRQRLARPLSMSLAFASVIC
jgi:hypothetical protein